MHKQLRREDVKRIRAVAVGEQAEPVEFRVELETTSEVKRESFIRNSKLDDEGKAMLAVVKDVVDNPGEERVDNLTTPAKWLLDSVVDDLTNDRPVSDPRFGALHIEEELPDPLLKDVEEATSRVMEKLAEDEEGKTMLVMAVFGEPEIIPSAPPDLREDTDFDLIMDAAVETAHSVGEETFINVLFRVADALDGGEDGRYAKLAVEVADEITMSGMSEDEMDIFENLMSGDIKPVEPPKPED